jgi:Zn-dependent M28 family amino/carboxypeptidase
MAPFTDMGFTTVSNKSVGSTDHIPFDRVGIPAFQFIQDNLEWGRHSHRTQDFADRLVLDDLRHNAIIMAWFAWCAANRDEMMPRK